MSNSKKTILKFAAISNGDMSGNLTSSVTQNQFLDSVCYELSWTGSPVGTFSVQVSNSYNPGGSPSGETPNVGIWTSVPMQYLSGGVLTVATTIPTSAGSPIFLDLALLTATFVRVIYVSSSGSGTLQAILSAKAIG